MIPENVQKALQAMATEAAEKAVASRNVGGAPAPVMKAEGQAMTPAQSMGLRFQKAFVDQYGHTVGAEAKAAIIQKAGLVGGTATAGAELIPVPVAEIVLPLRERSILAKGGAQVFNYANTLSLGKYAGVTVAATAENAAPSASSPTTSALVLGSYFGAAYVQVSNNALVSSPDVGAAVAEDIQAALAAYVDAKGFAGSGAGGEPTGLISQLHAGNTNDATTSATNATIRADLANAAKLVRLSGVQDMSSAYWTMGPAVFYSLLGKSDTNGAFAFPTLHNTVPTLLGFPVFVTTAFTTSVGLWVGAQVCLGFSVNDVGSGLQGSDLVAGSTTIYGRVGFDAKIRNDKCGATVDAVGVAGWY